MCSSNDVLELEIEAGGTRFATMGSSRVALESLMDASQWMIYQNTVTGVLHWDFVRNSLSCAMSSYQTHLLFVRAQRVGS